MFPTLIIAGAALAPACGPAGTAFAPAYWPPTIAATDGVAESEQGLASGPLHTATRFGPRSGSPR